MTIELGPWRRQHVLAGIIALALAACSGTAGLHSPPNRPAAGPEKAASIPGWLTTADGSRRLEAFEASEIGPAAGQAADVVVDIAERHQAFAGYGASVTDATAWLLMREMDGQARSRLLHEIFGNDGGLGLDITRITIGASDFSRSHYTYADTPGDPVADLAPAQAELLPALREAQSINPGLTIIASPWSAPAWMKTSHSLIKGRLDRAHYGDFARYLVSYGKAMEQAGVPIDLLTIQNEPHFEPADYPGMRVEPAERAEFVASYLGPLMKREVPEIGLLDWDHNWNEPESPIAVLSDPKASSYIDGVAWHCYDGEVSAQSVVHREFPDKETWFTECTGGSWSGDWSSAFQWSVRNLVIGAPRHWAKGVVMWNLALDQDHGPHLGGCGNCRGLVTINTDTGTITREPEYYAFAHGSRFLPARPVRVGTIANAAGTDAVAFLGDDGTRVSLIVFNGSPDKDSMLIAIDGRLFRAAMPRGSLATFVIDIHAN